MLSARFIVFASVLTAVSCGCWQNGRYAGGPKCVTKCGLTSSDVDCMALQELETAWVPEMSGPLWLDPEFTCALLKGWDVEVHRYRPSDALVCKQPRAWPTPRYHICIEGYTHEKTKVIELADCRIRTNALAHELVHAVDLGAHGYAGHCDWQKKGIMDALWNVTGHSDGTESDCPDAAPNEP